MRGICYPAPPKNGSLLSILLLIALLAGQPVAEGLPPLECVRLVREARLAEYAGEIGEASQLLTEAQQRFPREVLPVRELLRLHREHGQFTERVAELHDLLAARLRDVEYPLAPGTARFLVETAADDAETLESLRIGLEARLAEVLEGGAAREYLKVLAAVQGRLGLYPEARRTLGRLIAIEPTYPLVSQAVRIDLELERWESALELLRPLMEKGEEGTVWAPIYVELLAKTGRAAEALDEIERLRAEDPATAGLLQASAMLRQVAWDLYDAGDRERSESLWRMVLEDDPADLEAQLVLANLFSSEEDRRAREAEVDAQLEEETSPGVLYEMGVEYLTAGDDERAYDLLSRVASWFETNEIFWFNLGLAAMRLERWQETVDAYQRAVRLNDDRAASFSHLATGLRMLERYREAADAFEKALELEPSRVTDYYYLSECYRALGEDDKATRARREYDRRREG